MLSCLTFPLEKVIVGSEDNEELIFPVKGEGNISGEWGSWELKVELLL